MQIQTTTALNKISGLTKKIRGVQGGQGAGKTIAILIILIDYASRYEKKEIYIVSEEFSKMRDTCIKDFRKIMGSFNLYNSNNFIAEKLYRFPNSSFIKFLSTDKDDVGKGLRSDVVYFNEANKLEYEAYRQFASRSKNIFIDFNPDREFWYHEKIKKRNDCEHIELNFEDNEFISEEELSEILSYRNEAYFEDGSVKSDYFLNLWQVYGLGQLGFSLTTLFKPSQLKRFTLKDIENKKVDFNATFTDVAYGAGDYFCTVFSKIIENKVYIIDVIFNRLNLIDNEKILIDYLKRYNIVNYAIEVNAGGSYFGQTIKKEIQKNYIPRVAKGNKITRIITESSTILDNFLFRSDINLGSEYMNYLNNLTSFSTEGKNVNDDAPDATAGLSLILRQYFYMFN